jgi:thiol-disulfide isomerase/thioredoxin
MARTPTTDIPLGFPAPDFALPDARTGTLRNRRELMEAGPTVVVFMCNHCPFVVHILPQFVAFAKEYMARGVNFIAISSNDVAGYPMDGPEHMKALAEELDFGFPYLYDEGQDVARAYAAACTPDFSVFDAGQRCVYRGQFDGARPGNDVPVTGADMRQVLDTLLAEKAVPAAGQIPSLGCNIKWKPTA